MDKPIKHHFVPRVYLKYFAKRKNKKDYIIYCLNKGQQEAYPANTKDVAMEYHYNRVKSGELLPPVPEEDELFYERRFKELIEDKWDSIVNKFTATVTLSKQKVLSREIKLLLGEIIIIQLLRSPQVRNLSYKRGGDRCKKVINEMEPVIRGIGHPELLKKFTKAKSRFHYSNDFAKSAHLAAATDENRIKHMTELLVDNRFWFVYKNTNYKSFPFITSDNPVVFYNPISQKYGIGPNGIEYQNTIIMFPLTPKYLIITFHNNSPLGVLNSGVGDEFIDVDDSIVYNMNIHQVNQCSEKVFFPPDFGEAINRENA